MATFISLEEQLTALREVHDLMTKAKDILAPVVAFNVIADGVEGSLIDGLADLGAAIQEIENEMAVEDDYEYEGRGHFQPFAGMIPRNFYQWGV